MVSPLTLDLLGLVAVVFLVMLNGFFVAAEFSLVSVRQTLSNELVEQGNHTAVDVQATLKNPDRLKLTYLDDKPVSAQVPAEGD